MAKTEISKDANGITLEANYFMSGMMAILIGMAVFVFTLMDYEIDTKRMVPT